MHVAGPLGVTHLLILTKTELGTYLVCIHCINKQFKHFFGCYHAVQGVRDAQNAHSALYLQYCLHFYIIMFPETRPDLKKFEKK